MTNIKKGVYFSANDQVLDWAIAFLNSFRHFNPDLPLYLIPFNEACEELLKLKAQYHFDIYEDDSFKTLEEIGHSFELGYTSYSHHWFRRYAAFWGPLDSFMYLDARIVVLADLAIVIDALSKYDFDFLYYDCALDQVYEPSAFRRNLLQQGKAKGFLSGMWASKKGLFSLAEFSQFGIAALKHRKSLNNRNTDQAFINYCCDHKEMNYGHLAEVLGGYCHNAWARINHTVFKKENRYYLWDHGALDHKKQLLLMHWAGYKISPAMPNRKLFLRFCGKRKKISNIISAFSYPVEKAYTLFRKSKLINNYYHKFKNG